jgi:ferritin
MQIKTNENIKQPDPDIIEGGVVERDIEQPEYKYNQVISDKVAELLVKQISRELYNENLYSTFANYFAINGLDKLEDYYQGRADEEHEHHTWIRDYLRDANIPFAYPRVDEIEVEIEDHLDPFKQTVKAEIETTEWINDIAKAAQEEGDYQTLLSIIKKLQDEQVEEQSLSLKVLAMAAIDTDWLTKATEILEYYED